LPSPVDGLLDMSSLPPPFIAAANTVLPPVGEGNLPALSASQALVLKRIRDVPALPEVVNQIILLLGRANTPASEIAKLVAYDPGLSSRVLRMVNSAAYGFQREVSSIQHAIMILGFNTVRGLVLSASIFKLLKGEAKALGFDSKSFWLHSMLTAMLATYVGDAYKMDVKDEAFSAGMLHDVGKLVLAQHFSTEYMAVLSETSKLKQPIHGQGFWLREQLMLGLSHTDIGLHLADKWKLPDGLASVIGYHHSPDKAPEAKQGLVYLIALANELGVQWVEATKGKDGKPDFSVPPTFNVTALSLGVRSFFSLESDDDLLWLIQHHGDVQVKLNELMKAFN
jgi:putative nucleotidyltransferase with HDIG domain